MGIFLLILIGSWTIGGLSNLYSWGTGKKQTIGPGYYAFKFFVSAALITTALILLLI